MSVLTSKDIIYKQPGEKIAVSMNFANWIGTSITLSDPVVTIDETGLTIEDVQVSGQTVVMNISSGNNGATYRVQVEVDTSDGQILQGDGVLKVRTR